MVLSCRLHMHLSGQEHPAGNCAKDPVNKLAIPIKNTTNSANFIFYCKQKKNNNENKRGQPCAKLTTHNRRMRTIFPAQSILHLRSACIKCVKPLIKSDRAGCVDSDLAPYSNFCRPSGPIPSFFIFTHCSVCLTGVSLPPLPHLKEAASGQVALLCFFAPVRRLGMCLLVLGTLAS